VAVAVEIVAVAVAADIAKLAGNLLSTNLDFCAAK
jgi:hypothetical protein